MPDQAALAEGLFGEELIPSTGHSPSRLLPSRQASSTQRARETRGEIGQGGGGGAESEKPPIKIMISVDLRSSTNKSSDKVCY